MTSASIKDIAKGRSDLYRVSPFDLHVREGWNSRDMEDPANIEHVDQLARSIAEVGVKESLTVKVESGKAYVTDGHCRHAAALRAIEVYGADKAMLVPVKTEARDATEADQVFSQIVRNSGKPLTPFEQGKVFDRLVELGWTVDKIAAQAGFSTKHVNDLLTLQTVPETVKDKMRKGEVAPTMVTHAIKRNRGDVEAAAEDVEQAVASAKEEGKERATAKHLPKKATVPTKRKVKKVKVKPVDPRKAVRELKAILTAHPVTSPDALTVPDSDDIVLVPVAASEWARVCELLKIKVERKRRDEDLV